MNVVASFYLRAKHWQIFLLLFGVFVVGNVAMMSSMLATPRPLEDFGRVGLVFGAVIAVFMFCFFGWIWSLGLFLNSIVQSALRLKVGPFRFALIYPALYVFAFMAVFFQSAKPVLFAIIFPFHLLAMFCMFYLLYFASKSLVLAETGKPASFSDYAGPFFLIWFYPIGVWFIQPRVNRLYAERRDQHQTL